MAPEISSYLCDQIKQLARLFFNHYLAAIQAK
jgi:hypothetical protein